LTCLRSSVSSRKNPFILFVCKISLDDVMYSKMKGLAGLNGEKKTSSRQPGGGGKLALTT
jgi:hypothetical protein